MDAGELKRLKELEEENSQLKRMYANLKLSACSSERCCSKKAIKPDEKDILVDHMVTMYEVSQR